MLVLSQHQQHLSSNYETAYAGMSDEEEMLRSGHGVANSDGVGETFVDFSDELRELGLRAE